MVTLRVHTQKIKMHGCCVLALAVHGIPTHKELMQIVMLCYNKSNSITDIYG